MSEPFLGEIRPFSFGHAPRGWATCDGQLLPINQNQALFALLGTMYGGDGRTTFALPDLRGRAAMHIAQAHPQGQSAGTETVTLTVAQLPRTVMQPWPVPRRGPRRVRLARSGPRIPAGM